jgi:hypothetical protein
VAAPAGITHPWTAPEIPLSVGGESWGFA